MEFTTFIFFFLACIFSATGILIGILLNRKIDKIMLIANQNFNRIDDAARKFVELTSEANRVLLIRIQKQDQEINKLKQQIYSNKPQK